MTFNIITFGCKVNTYESEIIKEKLLASFSYIDDYKTSDIVIVNTCSVTNNADNKCHKMIRSIKRNNQNCILVVMGCSVQNNYQVYEELNADIILGNKDKSKIKDILLTYIDNKEKYIKIYDLTHTDFEDMTVSKFSSKTRAFVKIQDGCNNFCSYCIIPYLRGNIRSKDFDVSVKEIECLAKNGHKEIVLTGIHTGSYASQGKTLVDLLKEISKIDELQRIRISSIEITELNDAFLKELEVNSKICNHLHIPLQSGCDKTLKDMNRKYDCAYYLDKIKKIRSIREDISITTDVIVGFPNETEEDFQKSLEFIKKIGFTKVHVFPYSKRTGTKAASMDNQLDESIKHQRSRELISVSNELENTYYNKFIGKSLDFICEEVINNMSFGHTNNYINVEIDEPLKVHEEYCIVIKSIDNLNVKGVLK